jgi:hypothetical protein
MEKRGHIDLAEILRTGMDDYLMTYGNIPIKFRKVVNHICQCRTKGMGGRLYQCDTCKTRRVSFNSCRDRHCPKCQGTARAAWVAQRVSELLPIGYFHVVFTLPDSFNGINLKNKKVFYDLLYRSVAETLLELGKDPRWLGGNIGFMAVLHTWGQRLLEHPHIHCIIPGGGIRLDGKKWVNFRGNYLIPTEVMSRLFRGKFLDYFSGAVEGKQLHFPDADGSDYTPDGFRTFLRQQRIKDWVVYAKEPFGSTEQVVKYLGNYTNRIAISNNRLVSHENDRVTFRWKDYADGNKQKLMTVDGTEFIRRYFLHVLPDHFVRIRYYGILSNRDKTEKLERCFHLLLKRYEKKTIPAASIAATILAVMGIDITLCPQCRKGHFQEVKELLKIPDRYRFAPAA